MDDFEKYDSGFFFGRFNRLIDLIRKNRVLPIRPGWEQTPEGLVPPVTPEFDSSARAIEYWNLKIETTDEGDKEVSIKHPGKVKRTTAYDESGLVDVVDIAETFTPAVGKFLCLVVEPNLTVTLAMVEEWTGYPYPVKETDSDPAGKKILEKYYYVIWAFVAPPDSDDPDAPPDPDDPDSPPDPDDPDPPPDPDASDAPPRPIGSMAVSDTIMAVKWGYGTHLQFVLAQDETLTGHVIPYYQLVPGTGTEEPSAEE